MPRVEQARGTSGATSGTGAVIGEQHANLILPDPVPHHCRIRCHRFPTCDSN